MLFWRKKISSGEKKEIPDGLWLKCKKCGAMLYRRLVEKNYWVCEHCGYHFRIGALEYIKLLTDEFKPLYEDILSDDPLNFKGYKERIERDMKKTGLTEAIITGDAKISSYRVALGVMDFGFIGGSMGSVVGERVTRLIYHAIDERIPLITVNASGGARMQEGILSLMQMAKTAAALGLLSQHKIPYISVLTNPTMAGVMASYASLGDIVIAEPGALIGFAGPRVIKQTIKQELPPGFQTAEFLLEHGLVDMVVPRPKLKETIIKILDFFLK